MQPSAFPAPKSTLTTFGLRPKRSFGQNFLCDAQLVEKIADLAGPAAQIVEIGAGLGGLTWALLHRGHHVTAIERDRDLIPVLRSVLAGELQTGQLRLLEADAKSVELQECFDDPNAQHVLMGNLPYNITGPLLQQATRFSVHLHRAVFLVQLEVAARLTATVNSPDYGALTVFAGAAFDVRRALIVRKGAFYPQPTIDSAVVVLTPRTHPIPETPTFRSLVKAAFQMRRKTLRNAWRGQFNLPPSLLDACALRAAIELGDRGEALALEAFSRMAAEVDRELEASGNGAP